MNERLKERLEGWIGYECSTNCFSRELECRDANRSVVSDKKSSKVLACRYSRECVSFVHDYRSDRTMSVLVSAEFVGSMCCSNCPDYSVGIPRLRFPKTQSTSSLGSNPYTF